MLLLGRKEFLGLLHKVDPEPEWSPSKEVTVHNKGALEDDEKVDVAFLKRFTIMVVMLFLLLDAECLA